MTHETTATDEGANAALGPPGQAVVRGRQRRWPNGRFLRACERCGGAGYVAFHDWDWCARCDGSGIDPEDKTLRALVAAEATEAEAAS